MTEYNGKQLYTLPFPIPVEVNEFKQYNWNITFSESLKTTEKIDIERLFLQSVFKIDCIKYLSKDNEIEFRVNVPVKEDKKNKVYSFEFWLFVEIDKKSYGLLSIQGIEKNKWPYFRFPSAV